MGAIATLGGRRTNAELIRDCAALGYLHRDWSTLDPTWGTGRFWQLWRPAMLIASDLYTGGRDHQLGSKKPASWVYPTQYVARWDFTNLPAEDQSLDAVVFDPPYKLNGTSTGRGAATSDAGYGVNVPASWQERHQLINQGISEACRVARRTVLIKCQDQVCSGAKRWQTREFASTAEGCGFELIDQLHVQGARPQPASTPCRTCGGQGVWPQQDGTTPPCTICDGVGSRPRSQQHSHIDYSTLLVLARSRR